MPAHPHPTVRLRRLAGSLNRLRTARGLSREDVAEATGINKATLYRIEKAKVRPQARTLAAMLTLYEVEPDEQRALTRLLKDSSQSGWWQAYTDELPEEYSTYIEFENEARSVWNYESLYIPGLLQTEDYARAVIPGGMPSLSRQEVDRRVQVRMERQAILDRDPALRLWAICDEAAIHRAVGGPAVMRDQLLHLVSAMERPNVTLQVVPFNVGAHPGMPGSFVVLQFSGDPAVVYIDSMAGNLFLEEEADVHRYTGLYEHLRAVAISPDATRKLIIRVADEYQVREETDDE
ncbi:helix-turn-helix transcriptional regulator [Actinoallomurus spadix]|uniref:Helix-turn-helix transcriptional regulator n=1 Tax=Actinoallomurus spadix TaxID=79912 RepID=A0ABP3GKJ0_9ACTN|nr:helix-turn-helix transcriptional regulator [Actinoallomurus spadix]MCO5990112.1 helix-turn-helix transcriptional regulator [Actinoallomurus spadix]